MSTRKIAQSALPASDDVRDPVEPSVWSFGVILLRRPRLVFGLPLAFAVIAAVVAILAPRKYVASASFTADEGRSPQSQLSSQLGQLAVLLPQAGSNVPQFYADLLQSRPVLRDVVTSPYESSDHAFKGTLIEYLTGRKGNGDETVEAAIRELRDNLSVIVDRVTGVIRFSVSLPDRAISLQTAQRLLILVNEHHLRRRQAQARAESEFLAQRQTLAKQDLQSAEETLADFYARNRSWRNSPELSADEQRLQRQVSMRQQLYISLSETYESSRMGELRDTPPLAVLEHPEGFVEVAQRNVLRKAIVGGVLGLFLALMGALLLEYVQRTKSAGDPNYGQFRELWVKYTNRMRRRSAWTTRKDSRT